MTKAQRERAEVNLLKQYIKDNPSIKKMLDTLLDKESKDKVELEDIIRPTIEARLKEARMIGVQIGWQARTLSTVNYLKDMKTLDEAIKYFEQEEKKLKEKMNLPTVEEFKNLMNENEQQE